MSFDSKELEISFKHKIDALKEQNKLLEAQELEVLALDERLSELRTQVCAWRKELEKVARLDIVSLSTENLKQARHKENDLLFSIDLYEKRISYFQAMRDLTALKLASARERAAREQETFRDDYAEVLIELETDKLEPLIQALALLLQRYKDSSTRIAEAVTSWDHAVDRVVYKAIGPIRAKLKNTSFDAGSRPELEGVFLEPAKIALPNVNSLIGTKKLIQKAELDLEEAKAGVGL